MNAMPVALRPLLSLGRHDCRWPVGDPKDRGFGFCARPQEPGRPYCLRHCRTAWPTVYVA